MKTNLEIEINSVDDAKKFLAELYKNRESFHPEDDAKDVMFDPPITEEEIERLNELMFSCFVFLENPCEYVLELIENELN